MVFLLQNSAISAKLIFSLLLLCIASNLVSPTTEQLSIFLFLSVFSDSRSCKKKCVDFFKISDEKDLFKMKSFFLNTDEI